MTTGINDTYAVKKLMGERIKLARDKATYSRQDFADILNSQEARPVVQNKMDSISMERLKKWESGENPVAIEWIPLICKVLSCDAGYLFGEYEEKNHAAADICKATGLSEKAVSDLISYVDYAPHINGVLNLLLENGLFQVVQDIYTYYDFFAAHESEKEKYRRESKKNWTTIKKGDFAGASDLAGSMISDTVLESHEREVKALRLGLYESFISVIDRIVKKQHEENMHNQNK